MEKLVGLKERLTAIGDFANESVKLIDELMGNEEAKVNKVADKPKKEEKKSAKEPKKPAKEVEELEEEAEEAEEENPLAEIIAEYDLADKKIPELKELLNEAEVEYNKKAKNQSYFVDTVAQAIADGIIGGEDEEEDASEEVEDDPEEEEDDLTQEDVEAMSLKELLELAEENELEVPKKISKKVKEVRALVIETFFGEDEDDEDEEEEDEPDSVDGEDNEEETDDVSETDDDEDEPEPSPEVVKAEAKVRKNVAKQIKGGKLTTKKMKDFLKQYYDGDADCKDCKGCSEDEIVECYTDIQTLLVDDDGEVTELGTPYIRNNTDYCCGRELKKVEDELVCEICGESYDASDE